MPTNRIDTQAKSSDADIHARMAPLPEETIFWLDRQASHAVETFLTTHSLNPYLTDQATEEFVTESSLLIQVLPPPLLRRLVEFRSHGGREGVLLIKGLRVSDEEIGPTPAGWSLAAQAKKSYASEMYLIGCMSILGEPFSFATQHAGNLIQNIVPTADDPYAQTGSGSRVFLKWHVEDAFSDFRADFVGLLCLRADPSAATTFASVRNLRLPSKYKRILFEKRFLVEADAAHPVAQRRGPSLVSILHGNYEDPFVRLDPLHMRASKDDREAEEALVELMRLMASAGRQYVLERGDLLIMDNQRVLHGRTRFAPRFDGTDRWLQRVSVTADIRKWGSSRGNRFRVIE